MNIKKFNSVMREYEMSEVIPLGNFIALRLDAVGMSALRKRLGISEPFSEEITCILEVIAEHMMARYRTVLGFTISDEINLVLHPKEDRFGRRRDKLIADAAGFACASMMFAPKLHGKPQFPLMFDVKVSALPNTERVIDYIRWRQGMGFVNCMQAYCEYIVRGCSVCAATPGSDCHRLDKLSLRGRIRMIEDEGHKVGLHRRSPDERYGQLYFWKQEAVPKLGSANVVRRKLKSERPPLGPGIAPVVLGRMYG